MPRGKSKKGQVTKWDAVKQALADLGNDAMPVAIRDHINAKHGLNLTTSLISNYKTNILKKGGAKKANGRKRKGRRAATQARNAGAAGAISLADIQAVKQLVDRLGVDKLKELAQVLAR